MFPNIHPQDGFAFTAGDGFAHQRAVLVGGGNNFQPAIVDDQPGPAASETAHTRGFELFLERVETAEGGFEVVGQFARRYAARLWCKEFPEHRMVGVAASIVAHRATGIFRNRSEVADERFDGFAFERCVAGNRLVQVGDVSVVMFVVMDFHRHRVDVRFERVFWIRKGW